MSILVPLDLTPLPRKSAPSSNNSEGSPLFRQMRHWAGYNNIRVLAEDMYKTGFKTNKGLLKCIFILRLSTHHHIYKDAQRSLTPEIYAITAGWFRH